MKDKLVFIPCRLDRRDAKSALIDDADGWPRKVVGLLGRMDDRLVVAAQWLREAAGRHSDGWTSDTPFRRGIGWTFGPSDSTP